MVLRKHSHINILGVKACLVDEKAPLVGFAVIKWPIATIWLRRWSSSTH
jgi:hypothetical protein